MLDLPDDVNIFNVQRQCLVQAKLVRLTRELAAREIDGTWWKIPVSKTTREAELDHQWSWRKLVGLHRNQLTWELLAIQSASGAVQGAMVYRIDAKSQIADGEGAVYIHGLAAAPRNRPLLVDPPKYQKIGDVLLMAAVRHSYSLGLCGRVWLKSFPNEKLCRFYRNWGFEMTLENEDGMIDFELPTANAQRRLTSEGYL